MTRKLWLGLGAAALTSTISPQIPQAATSAAALESANRAGTGAAAHLRFAQTHEHGSPAKAGGEGGEGGEGSAAKTDSDARLEPALRFYRDIQLVRGHLLVGDELIQAGRWADALPHFLHPVEELYDKMAPSLKSRKLKPFLQQLKALAQTVKARNATAYAAALAAVNSRLDAVDAGMKSEKSDWTPFAVETALETMRSAIGEYTESIGDGTFAKAVEYQDSRGFVWQAERLLESVGAELAARYAEEAGKARKEIATLKSAWPAAIPPSKPVLDASAVASAVSRIELALGSVK